MFRSVADWMASTPVSQAFQNALWVVPTSQSIHLAAIGIVFGSAVILNLRLLGIGGSTRRISELFDTLLPWLWGGMTVLLMTGIVQTFAEPARQLKTPHFLWKMVMVLVVTVVTLLFHKSVRRHAAKWDAAAAKPTSGKLFALVTLALWVGIIICGRLIAYVWERYE